VTLRLGFLASHGGSNVQVIIDACGSGTLDAEPCVLVSNNSDAPVMARARAAGIATYHLSSRTHPDPSLLDDAILEALTRHGAALIVLAGYMKKIGPRTLARYRGLVLNIHPALLPKFGGQGMYGRRVHEEVLAAGDRMTGVTVHLADEEYDRGPILAQRESAGSARRHGGFARGSRARSRARAVRGDARAHRARRDQVSGHLSTIVARFLEHRGALQGHT